MLKGRSPIYLLFAVNVVLMLREASAFALRSGENLARQGEKPKPNQGMA